VSGCGSQVRTTFHGKACEKGRIVGQRLDWRGGPLGRRLERRRARRRYGFGLAACGEPRAMMPLVAPIG
jgi:hypothetical protein